MKAQGIAVLLSLFLFTSSALGENLAEFTDATVWGNQQATGNYASPMGTWKIFPATGETIANVRIEVKLQKQVSGEWQTANVAFNPRSATVMGPNTNGTWSASSYTQLPPGTYRMAPTITYQVVKNGQVVSEPSVERYGNEHTF